MKQIHVQARVNGDVIHDREMKGKRYWRDAIRIAMLAIDATGQSSGQIRIQTIGAKKWANYEYDGREARQDQSISWQVP